MEEHKCQEHINYDEVDISDEIRNERIEVECNCQKCGNTVNLSFVIDWFEVIENGEQKSSGQKYYL